MNPFAIACLHYTLGTNYETVFFAVFQFGKYIGNLFFGVFSNSFFSPTCKHIISMVVMMLVSTLTVLVVVMVLVVMLVSTLTVLVVVMVLMMMLVSTLTVLVVVMVLMMMLVSTLTVLVVVSTD